MNFSVVEIDTIRPEGLDLDQTRITIELDNDAREVLGRVDPLASLGILSFEFGLHLSEAAMLAAIRNELAAKKLRAQSANRLAHLVGKRFEF